MELQKNKLPIKSDIYKHINKQKVNSDDLQLWLQLMIYWCHLMFAITQKKYEIQVDMAF